MFTYNVKQNDDVNLPINNLINLKNPPLKKQSSKVSNPILESLAEQFSTDDVYNRFINQPAPWKTMVKEILALPDFTKSRIARELGISRRTINRWLVGETDRPHNRSFSRLFRLYCKLCIDHTKVKQADA